jgi:hypothetical protein
MGNRPDCFRRAEIKRAHLWCVFVNSDVSFDGLVDAHHAAIKADADSACAAMYSLNNQNHLKLHRNKITFRELRSHSYLFENAPPSALAIKFMATRSSFAESAAPR